MKFAGLCVLAAFAIVMATAPVARGDCTIESNIPQCFTPVCTGTEDVLFEKTGDWLQQDNCPVVYFSDGNKEIPVAVVRNAAGNDLSDGFEHDKDLNIPKDLKSVATVVGLTRELGTSNKSFADCFAAAGKSTITIDFLPLPKTSKGGLSRPKVCLMLSDLADVSDLLDFTEPETFAAFYRNKAAPCREAKDAKLHPDINLELDGKTINKVSSVTFEESDFDGFDELTSVGDKIFFYITDGSHARASYAILNITSTCCADDDTFAVDLFAWSVLDSSNYSSTCPGAPSANTNTPTATLVVMAVIILSAAALIICLALFKR